MTAPADFGTAQLACISEYRRLVGPSAQIAEQSRADAAVAQVFEFRIELPDEFSRADDEQILQDVAHAVAPAVGWEPAPTGGL